MNRTALTGGARRTAEHLERLIADGRLAHGSRLPTERELATELGCTRTEVRHALTSFEIDGRIERHVGRGTFLRLDSRPAPAGGGFSPSALLAASLLLEPEVLAVAAVAAEEADFAEMRRCLRGSDTSDTCEEFEEWDRALHHTFAVATHNAQLVAMVDLLNSTRNDPVWGRLKRNSFTPERCRSYRREHHEIVDALCDRDREAASRAMEAHIRSVQEAIFGGGGFA